jgi:DNA-binding SARP family transcriptional activator/tetratricopeptide (TPR) repeat protein
MAAVLRVLGDAEFGAPKTRRAFPHKGFQLLAYLAMAPSRRAPRRLLADLLWDNGAEAAGLGNLRQLLSRMRRHPEIGDLLASDSESVWLKAEGATAIDLVAFLDLMAARDPSAIIEALALYGELLAGVGDTSNAFSDWLRQARATIRERCFAGASGVLMELTRFGNASPDDLRAIEQRFLAIERDREASYRVLIEAYGRNGMKDDVVRLYSALQSVLRAELDAPVSAETRAVFRRASAGIPRLAIPPVRADFDLVRVAFLPLKMLAGHNDEELVRALFDHVANNLARYRTITVLAIHSSFRREQIAEDASNISLDADYHVSGFVLPDGVSLSMHMVDMRTAKIVWAADYSISPQALALTFRLLSQQVAGSLADALEHRRIVSTTPHPAANAYNWYLQGKMQLARVGVAELRRARHAFQHALDEQRHYGAANARMALTLYLEWLLLGGSDPQMLVAARAAADAAIAADPGGADGYWMRGVVSLYQRDFESCAENFATAESLSPHSADLLVQYADALSHLGRPAEGWQRFERALQLNPMPPDHYWWAGASIAFVEARYDEVIALCARMESDAPAMRLLAAAHALRGNAAEAARYGRLVRETYPDHSRETITRLVPSTDRDALSRFMEGLRLAGVD